MVSIELKEENLEQHFNDERRGKRRESLKKFLRKNGEKVEEVVAKVKPKGFHFVFFSFF